MKSIICSGQCRSSQCRARIFACLLLTLCAVVFGIYRTKLLDAPVAAQSASRPATEKVLAPDAATSRWRFTNGPMAGSVTALYKDGERLLAASGTGIYVSTDEGRSWKRANAQVRPIGLGGSFNYFTSFARGGSSLYAGGFAELLRSKDNGQTWTAVGGGLPESAYVQRIKTDGANVFALSLFAGIFASFDEGESWTLLTTPSDRPHDFTVSGTTIFVTTEKGVFRSTDLGRSWIAANNGLPEPDPQARTSFGSIARLGSKLFVSYYASSPSGLSQPFSSVYVSSDQGRSWTEAKTGFGDAVIGNLFATATDVFAPTSLGVFRFNESGMNWVAVNKGLRGDFNYVFAAAQTNLYVGGTNDIYVSQSRGDEWTALNVQINAALPNAYALAGNNLFAGARGGGVFRMNLAATPPVWERVNRGLMTTEIQALVVAGNNVFCGTRGAGVYRSTDQAQNWTAANNGLTDANVAALAVIGNTLFAGTEEGGVFRSADGGQNWTAVNQGLEEKRILTLAVKGASLFAGTNGKGLFRSDDNGANWKAVNQGLIVPGNERVNSITSIAVSGGNLLLNGSTNTSDTLGGVASLFRSKDNGETWEAFNSPISSGIGQSNDSTGIVLAANDTLLFAGTFSGAYVSSDLGATWREISEGLSFFIGRTVSVSALFPTPSMILATTGFNFFTIPGGFQDDGSFNYGVYSRELATINCKYMLDSRSLVANPAGETLTVSVATESACSWTVESNDGWITASPAETAGNGAVKLTVAANPTIAERTGTVTIAGEIVTVTQAAGAAISPNFQTFEQAGGASAVRITANDATNWTATSPASWVTFTGAVTGKGNGTINFTVAPNTSANSRRAELTIAGQKFVVSQSGAGGACGIAGTIAPGQSLRGELTTGDCISEEETKNGKKTFADRYALNVAAEDGLVISVDSSEFPAEFRLIPADGNRPMIVEVFSSRPRATGRYLLSLSKVTAGCSYSLSSFSRRVQADGETATISVTTRANCTWQAVSRADWLTVTAGANGTGTGTVTYKVSANASAEQRTAQLSLAGQNVSFIQVGNPNPTLELTGLAPASVLGGGAGFTLTVNGKGFVNGSKVLWNGRERRTTFLSGAQLKAEIPAADINLGRESVGQVSVLNPEPNGGQSRPQEFVILAPNQPWTPTPGPGGGTITTLYRDESQLLAGTFSGGIYRSTDRGQSWQRKFSGNATDYSIQQFAANAEYICGISQVITCSADGGETWQIRLDPKPVRLYSITGFGEDFLVAAADGIRRFRPSDNSFQQFNSPLNDNWVVTIAAAGRLIFAASRQSIFSGGNTRLFVSHDGGATWRSSVAGLPADASVQDILIAGPNVYVATLSDVYVSGDQGRNWRTLSFPTSALKLTLADSSLFALAYTYSLPPGAPLFQVFRLNQDGSWKGFSVEPQSSGLYAIVGDGANLLVGAEGTGILHSTDKGQSWQRINRGLAATSVVGFASIGSTLYAAAIGTGVFRSDDGGRSWTPVNNGFKTLQINALAANGSVLFAAAADGVYRSTDEGRNWINTGIAGRNINSFAFSDENVFVGARNLFGGIGFPSGGGIFVSNNNGQSWRDLSSRMPTEGVNALLFKGRNLFAATDQGLLVSADNGLSWSKETEEIGAQRVWTLAAMGDTILVGAAEGVFASTNEGRSWQLRGLLDAPLTSFTVSGTRLFALRTDQGACPVVSENKGETWVNVCGNLRDKTVQTLFVHQARLFAGTNGEGVYVGDPSPNAVANVSAAGFQGGELAPDSIAVAFGSEFVSGFQAEGGESIPVEETTRVLVRDVRNREREARLFFVSSRQINFLIPADIAEGEARIAVVNGDGRTSTGTARIARVAPGLFTANGNGQGVAGGFVLRIKANGERVYESPARFDSTQNRFVPAPIDVSSPNEQVFLALFGTGLRNRNGLSSVSVKLGGVELPVLYAGAQNDFAGLDQINVRLPNTLAGRGELSLELTVEGKRANPVTVGIK